MTIKNQLGYSLVELLVSLVIGLIIMGGIYLSATSQERNMNIEDRVGEVQANLRSGLYILERDLRSAGYDPTCASPPCLGFTNATSTSFSFRRRNPTTNAIETITYGLYDSQGDGDMDLGRNVNGSGNQPVILNVDAVDFVYFDNTGTRLATPLTPADLNDIQIVEITLVAHSEIPDPNFTSSQTFQNLQGETVFIPSSSDHFRRRSIRTRVLCRNSF